MRSKFLAALSACLCCTIMLVTAQKASATETAGCATCPGGSTETTVNVTFCSMGTSYNVDVTYCSKRYTTPQTGLACSPLRGIDEYTVIKKVCASGTALPPTDAETLTAVFCKLNPMGGDLLGIASLIPYCDTAPNVFCWQIAFPKCTARTGGCIVVCDNSACCIKTIEYCRVRSTGLLSATVVNTCDPTCTGSCTDAGCAYNPNTACETCP